ncbi:MAG TPA: MFS transporter [Vicinamibacterales bacterium]
MKFDNRPAAAAKHTDKLFTPRFFILWAYNFIVFLSAFQLLPTAPFHILSLGGSHVAVGLFLGFLTYASAISAPITGALADRWGKRNMLLVAALALTGFSILYAFAPSYQLILALVLIHGVFWSCLLSSSSAYMLDIVPASRRAEGLGYSGFASILAIAVAPWLGLWVFDHGGWTLLCIEAAVLNLIMAVIAWRLPRDRTHAAAVDRKLHFGNLIEWRVLIVGFTLFLYSFSYGGITSFVAVYAEHVGVTPRALYFTVLSFAILSTRPFIGRYADRVGHNRIIVPCLALVVLGVATLTIADSRAMFVVSALVFGVGFGSVYPLFVAHLMHNMPEHRRGATFGALIGAFDTGIGTGSIAIGWMSERYGFSRAFAVAATLAALSIPYYLFLERRQWITSASAQQA